MALITSGCVPFREAIAAMLKELAARGETAAVREAVVAISVSGTQILPAAMAAYGCAQLQSIWIIPTAAVS